MFFERAEQLGQDPRGLKLTMGGCQELPQTAPWLTQLGQQLRRYLADRLRFARELGQIMAVNYPAATEPYPRMDNALTHADQADFFHTDESGGTQSGPARWRRVPSSFDLDQRPRADLDHNWFAYLEQRARIAWPGIAYSSGDFNRLTAHPAADYASSPGSQFRPKAFHHREKLFSCNHHFRDFDRRRHNC